MTSRITFVGPLPPPVHGFANICNEMLQRLRARSSVQVFDRAPRHNALRHQLRQLSGPFRYFATCLRVRRGSIYLGLSGGLGQAFDAVYLLFARVSGQRMFVHHHSFAYVNSASPLNRLLFAVARNAVHVVLSAKMGAQLACRYGIHANRIRVLSNAAFFASPAQFVAERSPAHGPLRIGFLSNISFEKGIDEFFQVLEQLRDKQVAYNAVIAGPVAPEAQDEFERSLARAPQTAYIGAVYAEAKTQFFRGIQVLLFPTKYVNEAEPLVIHEALRSSVYVVACDRGAIAEVLQNRAGLALQSENFVEQAASHLAQLQSDQLVLEAARRAAHDQATRIQRAATSQLELLLDEIVLGRTG